MSETTPLQAFVEEFREFREDYRKDRSDIKKSLERLGHDINGNGRPGLKERVTRLEERVAFVAAGISAVIAALPAGLDWVGSALGMK